MSQVNEYGQKYVVRSMLKGPSGQVWIILVGERVPRFVTAFPGGSE